jgi:outer membrane protein assembly factor BamD (BamD/ComL family)
LKQQLYGPALRHFYQVIDHYQDTPQAIEAHYRLVETYALLHDTAKAKFHAAIVKREGGGTVWLEKAEAWLAQADTGAVTLPAAVTAAPVSSLTKTP